MGEVIISEENKRFDIRMLRNTRSDLSSLKNSSGIEASNPLSSFPYITVLPSPIPVRSKRGYEKRVRKCVNKNNWNCKCMIQ